MILKRKQRVKMNVREPSVIRCPSHLKWVRGCECAVSGKLQQLGDGYAKHHTCEGKIEAHHVREGDHGQGMGQKPDDSTAVPLCSHAHKRGHDIGWQTFEKEWRVNLSSIAEALWKASPHGIKYRREHDKAMRE
jgi:hypothetical protein